MGLARVWMPDDNLTLAGCMGYMPFEFYTGKYDQSLDIYTFGLTLNELFTEKRHQANILTRRIKLTCESPVFSDLINRCIHFVTSQRPSAIEVETTLQMYKQAFEKYVVQQHIEYTDMSPEERNSTFVAIYAALHPDIDQILKDKFPRPPPPPARRPEEAAAAAADLNTGEINILQFLELLQQLGDR
jgi:serine/threonine protein kinase